MKDDFYKPELGDKLFTRGSHKRHEATAWATQHKGEKPTLATHVGTFKSKDVVIEAGDKGVVANNWTSRRSTMIGEDSHYCIIRRSVELKGADRMTYLEALESTIGKTYGWFELPLQAADGIIGKVIGKNIILFRFLGEIIPGTVICSKASAIPEIAIQELPKLYRFSSPDGLYDFMIKNGNWGLVEHSRDWYNEFMEKKS